MTPLVTLRGKFRLRDGATGAQLEEFFRKQRATGRLVEAHAMLRRQRDAWHRYWIITTIGNVAMLLVVAGFVAFGAGTVSYTSVLGWPVAIFSTFAAWRSSRLSNRWYAGIKDAIEAIDWVHERAGELFESAS